MDNTRDLSLAELEALYQKRHEHWTELHYKILRDAEESRKQAELYEQKLSHIRALVDGTEIPETKPRPKVRRLRRRKSVWREATLEALRTRAGQKLSEADIREAILEDIGKHCSRQTINNNIYILEQEGLILRERAPRGSGAQFVFSAVPGGQDPKKGG